VGAFTKQSDGAKEEDMDISVLLSQMTLKDAAGFVGAPKELLEQINQELSQIPNERK
jgi:hypothetical protein